MKASTPPPLKPDSLAFSLLGAAQAVTLVQGGTALPQALARIFADITPSPQARGAIQDLAYRAMREWARTDAALAILAAKAPSPELLRGLLACALALLFNPEDDSYEAFTVVDQAVAAAASDPSIAHAKGMVNAVLRRFLRERDALRQQIMQKPEALWNYPGWWIKAAQSAYPKNWQDILEAGNAIPPLTLRVNLRRINVDAYLKLLSEHGMTATQIGPSAVRLEKPVPVSQIPGFDDGLASVQDAAAQLAAPLLDLQDGMRVLDACAAPGGKTGHILESANVDLLALDVDQSRLPRIEQNLQRLQLRANLVAGDARTHSWWDGKLFDRIVVDAPCTASGIVRRHPDIRWLRRPGDAVQLATLSAQILDNLWQMLGPDGKLLFVTCSLWPHESEAQAAAFEARTQATRLQAPGQLLPKVNDKSDQDGLFYALFQKRAA